MIVITGGAGFIGSRILRAVVLERSLEVLVADRDLTHEKRANLAGVPLVELIDPSRLLEIADRGPGFSRRVEAVVHMGACTDTWERDVRLVFERNLWFSTRLLRWCLQRRIPLVYASSSAIYGTGGSGKEDRASGHGLGPYARSKLLFDSTVARVLPASGSPLAGLRLFNVYGPGEAHKGRMASVVYQFHRQLHDIGLIEIYQDSSLGPPGGQRRDLVHVDDVVAVALWFLDRGSSGIFDVGTGEARSFNELAQIVLAHQGFGAVRYVPLPERLRGVYQSFTEADLTALRAAGYGGSFRPPEEGIPAYLRQRTGTGGTRPPRHC